jgi:hypothetical protein
MHACTNESTAKLVIWLAIYEKEKRIYKRQIKFLFFP